MIVDESSCQSVPAIVTGWFLLGTRARVQGLERVTCTGYQGHVRERRQGHIPILQKIEAFYFMIMVGKKISLYRINRSIEQNSSEILNHSGRYPLTL